jgi:transcriptional regulator with PAS, ATPase and Fis domain
MADASHPGPDAESYHWQALFQRTSEPLFVLNRRRRIVFVNEAWERFLGLPAAQAINLLCKRSPAATAEPLADLAAVLAPPPAVRDGQAGRIRRLLPVPGAAPIPIEIDFFPLRSEAGLLGILGKLTPLAVPQTATPVLPEKVHALREALVQRFRFELQPAESPAMLRVLEQARLAAQTRASVLLVGERGTGKRWLARTIHHQGSARDRVFVELDCAGLPPTALTAALLGPGGLGRRPGVGTIFLAHVASLPRETQAQVCDWLAEDEMHRPRVLASLVGDPAELIQQGRLLHELHCSLATLLIAVPPLRQRLAELPLLVQAIMDHANADGPRRLQGLTPEAWEMVRNYPWPANLRELDTVLRQAYDRAAGDRITAADLPAYVQRSVELEQVAGREPLRPLPLKQLLEQVERRLIEMALRRARGKKGRAARLLAIWRPLLLRRMEKLGIKDE